MDEKDKQNLEVGNTTPNIVVESKESLEITKNSKGYNYTIKILEINIKRMKEITDELNRIYNIT